MIQDQILLMTKHCEKWKSLSHVWLFETPETIQSMEFSGQNTGVGSRSLLQGIFPTQGSNPGLPHCMWILYQLSHRGSPRILCVQRFDLWVWGVPWALGFLKPRQRTLTFSRDWEPWAWKMPDFFLFCSLLLGQLACRYFGVEASLSEGQKASKPTQRGHKSLVC